MHENDIKAKEHKEERIDSFTLGTGKSGQLKVYLDVLDRDDTTARLNAFKDTVAWLRASGLGADI
jgi:hypothetical protein